MVTETTGNSLRMRDYDQLDLVAHKVRRAEQQYERGLITESERDRQQILAVLENPVFARVAEELVRSTQRIEGDDTYGL